MNITRLDECQCKRCHCIYTNKLYISEKSFNKNIDLYTSLCIDCRKIKECKNCSKEFKHYQNQTCSKKCAEELKVKSYIKSCGSPHNFCKNSKSRKNWELRLLEDEGITNVFQREEVKEKLRNTMNERYGTWYSSSKKGKEKIRKVFFEKYGKHWISLEIPEIYEAYVKTSRKNWGTDHWSQSKEGSKILSKLLKDIRNSEWFKQLQISKGNWKDRSNLKEIENYYFNVYKITEFNLSKHGTHKFGVGWESKRSIKDHHIDHIYPIIKSYYLGIPPELVGNIENLELMPFTENLKKGVSIIKIPNHIKTWLNENKEY
jgi:hypothetical protein